MECQRCKVEMKLHENETGIYRDSTQDPILEEYYPFFPYYKCPKCLQEISSKWVEGVK